MHTPVKISTAYLRIDNFYSDFEDYKSFLEKSFNKIADSEATNLILDIRSNSGGDITYTAFLLNYLTDKPYHAYSKSIGKISEATKKSLKADEYLEEDIKYFTEMQEYLSFDVKSSFDSALYGVNGTLNEVKHHPIKPQNVENKFKGNIYLLVGVKTYSTATDFATIIKDNSIATVVGEVTGGVPSGYGMMMDFKLQNTGFQVINSTNYYVRPAGYDDGKGLIPDYLVEPTELDFINEYDRILDYTRNLIKNGVQ